MTKRIYLISIKALIILSPIPFGCVGKIFSPLFYLLLLIVSFIGLNQPKEKSDIPYEKWMRRFFYFFLVFLGFQLVPLPLFVLKILSPKTVEILSSLTDEVPAFHPLSLAPYETLGYGFQFLVFALFFVVVIRIKLGKHDMIGLLNAAVLSVVLQVIIALLKYAGGNRYFFLFFLENQDRDRVTGTLGNADHFAFYLEMMLPLILALFFFRLKNRRRHIIFYFIAAVLAGTGIFLSGSRGGIAVMVLSMMIFALLSAYLEFSNQVRRKLKVIVVLILCLVVFFGVQNTVGRFLETRLEKEARLNIRWPGTAAMILDFPLLGTGFGTYRYSYYLYDNEEGTHWTTHAHNEYLESFSDGGIVGGALFLTLVGMIIFSIFKTWRQRHRPEVKLLGLGITAGFFAVILHSAFDFALRIPSNAFLFVLLLALGVKIVNYRKRDKRENEQ